ncbi:MAG: hypothetical protein IK102_04010 [Treponema sp.]|nr:hypothetical protein [Treponema sp.]
MSKKSLFILAGALLFLLTSCENFMNGSNIREELDRTIEQANAKSVTIVVSQDTTMGSFLSSGDKQCKINISITVQYNLKKDLYIFKGLKAVSQSNTEKSRNDCVQFEIVDHDDQRGIYKVSIKVIKEADDILILPDCAAIPNVVKDECKPEYKESGVEQDTTIEIALNTAIKSIEYFSPVITDSNGKSLTDYFEKPYLSSDKKTICIPTNKIKKLLNTDGNAETKDIIIKIDLSELADEEGNTGSGTFQYKYRINQTRDTKLPVLSSAVLYFNSDKAQEIQKKEPANWSDSDFNLYHIRNTVYIEAEASDEGSGVRGFLVKEKVLNLPDGSEADGTPSEVHEKCSIYEKTGKYAATYTINTIYDGIIELEFFAEDNSDNHSTKSTKIYVLKDITIDAGSIKFQQEIGGFPNTRDDWLNAIPIVDGDKQKVELTLNRDIKDIYYSTESKEYSSPYSIDAYWGYSEEDINTKITKNSEGKYIFTRDVTKMVFIKLNCRDSIGNEKQLIKRMDPRAEIEESIGVGFDLKISNIDLLLSLCHITEQQYFQHCNYCRYIYEFSYPNDEESFESVSISKVEFGPGIISALNAYNYTVNSPDQLPHFNLKIYMTTTIGDFPSPRSQSYGKTSISNWRDANDNEEAIAQKVAEIDHNNATIVFPYATPNASTSEDESYGPTDSPYIKNTIKIIAEPLTNAGSYQITIDDYKAEGALNNENISYTFYALPYEVSEESIKPSRGGIIQSRKPEFLLKSPNRYFLFISAYDKKSNKKYMPVPFPGELIEPNEEPGISFYLNNQTTASKNLILTQDLTPPIINNNTDVFYLPGCYSIWSPNDGVINEGEEPSLILDSNNKATITYYIIPNPGNNINFVPSYTHNELETQYSGFANTYKFTPEGFPNYDSQLLIPYGNLRGGFYSISFVVKDKNNNSTVLTRPFINNIIGELPITINHSFEPTFGPDGTPIGSPAWCSTYTIQPDTEEHPEIKIITKNNKEIPSIHAELQFLHSDNLQGDNWVGDGYSLCHTNQYGNNITVSQSSQATASFMHSFQNETPYPWARIIAFYGFNETDSILGKGFYNIKYVYCGPTEETCISKNCMEAMNGIQVFSDRPVLAHTMYCKDKLTETKDDKNACTIWENRGTETGLALIGQITCEYDSNYNPTYKSTGDGTYTNSMLGKIPAGAWYTTIFHFADGDVVMTDIKQK